MYIHHISSLYTPKVSSSLFFPWDLLNMITSTPATGGGLAKKSKKQSTNSGCGYQPWMVWSSFTMFYHVFLVYPYPAGLLPTPLRCKGGKLGRYWANRGKMINFPRGSPPFDFSLHPSTDLRLEFHLHIHENPSSATMVPYLAISPLLHGPFFERNGSWREQPFTETGNCLVSVCFKYVLYKYV